MGSSEEALIEATNVYACCMLAIMLWDCKAAVDKVAGKAWNAALITKILHFFC